MYKSAPDNGYFCVSTSSLSNELNEDICHLDPGSPVVSYEKGFGQLTGVVGSCSTDKKNIFITNTVTYANWMKKIIKDKCGKNNAKTAGEKNNAKTTGQRGKKGKKWKGGGKKSNWGGGKGGGKKNKWGDWMAWSTCSKTCDEGLFDE